MNAADSISRAKQLAGTLSGLELAFLRSLANGHSQADIARDLDLSANETAELRKSVMRRLGASSTADAVRIAIYAGL